MKLNKPCLHCGDNLLDRYKNKTFCGEECRESYIEGLTEKKCKGCSEVKPIVEFTKQKGTFDRLQAKCKACIAIRWKQWYAKNHDTAKSKNAEANRKKYERDSSEDKHLKRISRYGLTEDDFNILMERSGGLCEICKRSPVEAIDHCHSSGKVRGLLCNHCNRSLGGFRDDVDTLQSAIQYVTING